MARSKTPRSKGARGPRDLLTRAQARVLRRIVALTAKLGYPPTRAEISEACGFASSNAAQDYLIALQKKGKVRVVPNVARGIIVL